MAEIIGGGEPVNDAERAVIRHLRDHGPAHWVVLHNFELRLRDNRKYEIDVLVVTEYAVTLIDVKGTRGRIEVVGGRWYPANRQPFRSPVEKLRGHARALKGNLTPHGPEPGLRRRPGRAHRPRTPASSTAATGPDADAHARGHRPRRPDPRAQQAGTGPAALPPRHPPVPRPDHQRARPASSQRAHRAAAVRALGGHRVARRDRGGHRVPGAERRRPRRASSALLRVYHADPFQPEDVRAAERIALANAYDMLLRLPSHAVRRRLPGLLPQRGREPVRPGPRGRDRAGALLLHLTDPQLALTMDAKLRVIRDMLRGLAHAHANRVLHRALSPTTVLVTHGRRRRC